jgi:hypothetical protein
MDLSPPRKWIFSTPKPDAAVPAWQGAAGARPFESQGFDAHMKGKIDADERSWGLSSLFS